MIAHRIDWLGNVHDATGRHRIGMLICGPDEHGYTISTGAGLEHVSAECVEIQLRASGPYVFGEINAAKDSK